MMRVTRPAQRAVLHARGEAARLGHDRVGPEHLLLALLADRDSLAVAALGERGVEAETVRRRVEEATGPAAGDGGPEDAGDGRPGSEGDGRSEGEDDGRSEGEGDRRSEGGDLPPGYRLPTTRPFTLVLGLAGREAVELEHDRVGTEHLLLGVAQEGEGVAARVLEGLDAGLLQLREAVLALYAAGTDPEPFPPDRGPPPWEPPAGARLRRVVPLASEHPLPSGDLLVLLSLEIWSDWLDLRYAIAYATPEPEGDLPRPPVLGVCELSDRAGTEYINWHSSSPSFGMVRVHQRTFVPAPPPGTELLELRFGDPSTVRPQEAPPLIVSTVAL
jgi:hypothetical protein